jgi:hypothetical protein
MRLTVRLDPDRLTQSHLRLVRRLARRPQTQLGVEWSAGNDRLPFAAAAVAVVERLIHRLPANDALAAASVADFAPFVARDRTEADLVLDLVNGPLWAGERTWRVSFDGAYGAAAAVGAITRSCTPVVAVVDASTGSEIVSGHPGTEHGRILTCAFDDVMARTATLVAAALNGTVTRHAGERPVPAPASTTAIIRFALKSLSFAALSPLYRLLYHTPHWCTGWRFVDGVDVVDLRSHPRFRLRRTGVRFSLSKISNTTWAVA